MPKLRIAQKLPLVVVGVALLALIAMGAGSYFVSAQSILAIKKGRLQILAQERAVELERFYDMITQDAVATSSSSTTLNAINELTLGFGGLLPGQKSGEAELLQKAFITDNPNPVGKKQLLDSSLALPGTYSDSHSRYNPTFRGQMNARGYGDIFLFDLAGDLVYSVAKNRDFGENFADAGSLGASPLGTAFQDAVKMSKPGDFAFVDVAPYAPLGAPAGFVAAPVFGGDGRTAIGVVALEMPQTAIDAMLNSPVGLGDTGAAFFVGPDHLFRNDSKFTGADDVLRTAFVDPVVDEALGGTIAFGESEYHGITMLTAAAPVSFGGAHWALVTVIGKDEALAPLVQLRALMLGIAVGVVLIAALLGYLFSRSIARPLTRLTRSMASLAEGDLDAAVPGAARPDELGAMARAVEVFRQNGIRVRDLTEEERVGADRRRNERVAMMQELQRSFGEVVDSAVDGDFKQRVNATFPDAELNQLARSVNTLVETVEQGIGDTGEVLAALANTDLTRRMAGTYHGAFRELADDTNSVSDKLGAIVSEIRSTSRALKTATGEILMGSNDLSLRTTRQAATIEETSAAIEQLAATVSDNAQRASQASRKAKDVSQSAVEGGEVMQRASDAMQRIMTSSSKISNIIGLIDDVAFQTNLLALNASVEAARAGDAGKGFAVVAVEVRRLAQSAAQASTQVKGLIEESSSDVASGTKLVREAAAKLEVMLSTASESSALIGAIATASREQASSIEEVSGAVRQLDEMTQHNAALVEETNAAIEQTERQAVELDRIVDVFTFEEPREVEKRQGLRRSKAA